MEIQLAIVDEDAEYLDRIADFAERTVGFARPAVFRSAAAARRGLVRRDYDVIVVDVALGRSTGPELIREIHAARPGARIVVLTSQLDDHLVTESFAQGADGYLLKTQPLAEILSTLLAFFRGGLAVEARVMARVIGHLRTGRSFEVSIGSLSSRENSILRRLSHGESYKTIATSLGLSPQTVYTHAKRMFRKLGVGSKTEAVARYLRPQHARAAAQPAAASPAPETIPGHPAETPAALFQESLDEVALLVPG